MELFIKLFDIQFQTEWLSILHFRYHVHVRHNLAEAYVLCTYLIQFLLVSTVIKKDEL